MDRSAAYAARWVAKSLVKAGLCKRVLVQISYAIGIAEPLSITIFSYGSSSKSEKELLDIVKNNFDLRPGKIVKWVAVLMIHDHENVVHFFVHLVLGYFNDLGCALDYEWLKLIIEFFSIINF